MHEADRVGETITRSAEEVLETKQQLDQLNMSCRASWWLFSLLVSDFQFAESLRRNIEFSRQDISIYFSFVYGNMFAVTIQSWRYLIIYSGFCTMLL